MDYRFEEQAREQGYKIICGIDEAGRGPLAGPVCAAAVVLPPDCEIEGLDDSKKLTEKKRDAVFEIIKEKAVSYSVAFASVEEIEEINILQATFLAMKRAVDGLEETPEIAIVDGNQKPNLGETVARTLVKGDSKCPSVAAASILAKVTRDRYMSELDEKYPQYAFKQHKGYGTKLHYERIAEYGISPVHRKSFLKKIIGE